jgi:hypothetical protein
MKKSVTAANVAIANLAVNTVRLVIAIIVFIRDYCGF